MRDERLESPAISHPILSMATAEPSSDFLDESVEKVFSSLLLLINAAVLGYDFGAMVTMVLVVSARRVRHFARR